MGRTWVMVDGGELTGLTGELTAAASALDEACRSLGAATAWLAGRRFQAEGALATFTGVVGAVATATTVADRTRDAVGGRAAALASALREYDGAESVPRFLDVVLASPVPGPSTALGVASGLVSAAALAALATDSLGSGELRMRGLWTAILARSTGLAGVGRAVSARQWGPDPVGGLGATFGLVGSGPLGPLVPGSQAFARISDVLGRIDAQIEVEPPIAGGSTAAGGIGDLAARIDVAYEEVPEGAGAVDVQRVEHADGRVTWLVSVPGTQGFGAALGRSTVPMAGDVNPAAYLGMQGPPDALVLAAMEQAQIGPDEPVVLAGHSLAGMVVMHLAASSAVRERYSVAAVVTFGSPVGHLPPAPVPTLHVRHAEDGTPSLSGVAGARPGGPAPGEVVVVHELGGSPPMSVAHDVGGYERTARDLEASGHPGLRGWEEATNDLWAREGDTVTSTLHVGRTG